MAGLAQRQAAISELLRRSGRDWVPIRRSFVQAPGRRGGAGPLATFVSERRGRALDLYLLARVLASQEPWDATLAATVWARLLGLEGRNATSLVSRNWTWLEEQRLVVTRRKGRLREVTILREDGSGRPYVHPGVGEHPEGFYFKLPHSYFALGYPDRMGLPAKAVLLIALSLEDDFILPIDHAPRWYGLSRDSLKSGLKTLRLLGLLDVRSQRKTAPLSPLGYTIQRHYRVRPPLRIRGSTAADSVAAAGLS
jgi:hypothetical protein